MLLQHTFQNKNSPAPSTYFGLIFQIYFKMVPNLSYRDHLHPAVLLQEICDLQHSNHLCDVTLIVENQEINAHRIVLAASSLYFRTMFCGSLKESKQTEIFLYNLEYDVFREVIQFIYTGEIEIDEDNVYSVMTMADFLQIPALHYPCYQYLQSILCAENCISMYCTAVNSGYNDLAHEALRCVLRNFQTVVGEPEFLDISVEVLVTILDSSYINIEEESQLLEAFVQWIKHDCSNRIKHISLIERLIHLEAVPAEKLMLLKTDSSFLKSDLSTIIDENINRILASKYDQPKQDCSLDNKDNIYRHQRYNSEQQVMLVLGGKMDETVTHASVECFTPGFCQWSHHLPGHKVCIRSMHYPRSSFAAASKDYDVYVVGGRNQDGLLNSAELYSVKTNSWDILPNLPEVIEGPAATISDGRLVVTGGHSETGYKSSTWVFDKNLNIWQKLQPMKTYRGFHCSVSSGGIVFALGGIGGEKTSSEKCLSTVERLNTSHDSWHFVAPMIQARAHFGCVTDQQFIYVVGGCYEEIYLRTIERYNALTDTWCMLRQMQVPRADFGITVFHNRIYCCGGNDSIHALSSVEKYNPNTDMWHCVISMKVKRISPVAVTVYIPSFAEEVS